MNPMEPRSARQEQGFSEGYGFRTVQDVSGRITQTRIRNQQVLGSIPSAGSSSSITSTISRPGSTARGKRRGNSLMAKVRSPPRSRRAPPQAGLVIPPLTDGWDSRFPHSAGRPASGGRAYLRGRHERPSAAGDREEGQGRPRLVVPRGRDLGSQVAPRRRQAHPRPSVQESGPASAEAAADLGSRQPAPSAQRYGCLRAQG